MSCKFFGGITRAELELLRKDLAKEGVTVPPGDEVVVTGPYAIELHITYHADKETLKICIQKKPFYIPESMVWQVVDAAVAPYEGQQPT